MSDKTLGMILATAIAAPIVIVCCGGGLALLGAGLTGATGLFSGLGGPLSVLLAIAVGGVLLALPRLRKPLGDGERQDGTKERRS